MPSTPTEIDAQTLEKVSQLEVLNEKGEEQEIINPHPDFRLIMTVDPHHGEISRAMRNRGVEIALLDCHEVANDHRLTAVKRLPNTGPRQSTYAAEESKEIIRPIVKSSAQ